MVPDPAAGAHAEMAARRESLRRLRASEWWRIGEHDLIGLARELEATGRSLAGVGIRVTGELVERGTAEMLGARTPAAMLHEALNITQAEARARVRIARAGLPRETLSGDTIAPLVPEALAVLDRGSISPDHAAVIVDTVTWIPAAVDDETRGVCRDLLLHEAQVGDVIRLKKVAEQIRHIVDPDGTLDGRHPADRMELHIGERRRDGLSAIRGLLDQTTTEALRQAVEPLAQPQPIDKNTPDQRPPALRRAQALGEVLARYLATGKAPIDGGFRPQVVVTIDLDQLLDRIGSGTADYTGPISAATARMLACDAEIIPQVLGSDSVVLDQGRAVRLFPPEIRRAIVTRDRGCTFPGCDAPSAWCDAHHIAWWTRDFGPTCERNGCLLCRKHHVLIHQGDWEVRMADLGHPEYIPPRDVDPARTPVTNQHWRIPTIAIGRSAMATRGAVMRT